MGLKSIEQEWQGFSGMIFQKMKPSQVQVEETKKAFFAGAWAMLHAMREVGEDHISEEQGMQYFTDRQREGEEFYKRMMREHVERN